MFSRERRYTKLGDKAVELPILNVAQEQLKALFKCRSIDKKCELSLAELEKACEALKPEFLAIFPNGCEYGEASEHFTDEQRDVMFRCFFLNFSSMIHTASDYSEAARHFTEIQKTLLYESQKGSLTALIKTAYDFQYLSSALLPAERHSLFKDNQMLLMTKVQTGYELDAVTMYLAKDDCDNFIENFFAINRPLSLSSLSELALILAKLPETKRLEYSSRLLDSYLTTMSQVSEKLKNTRRFFDADYLVGLMSSLNNYVARDDLAGVVGRLKLKDIPENKRGFIVEQLVLQVKTLSRQNDEEDAEHYFNGTIN